jgi:hypothetical protein
VKLGRLVIRKRRGLRLHIRLRPPEAQMDAIVREISEKWSRDPRHAALPLSLTRSPEQPGTPSITEE